MKKLILILALLSVASVAQAVDLPSKSSIISAVNSQRVSNGLPALVENSLLNQAALLKAQNLADQGALVHTQSVVGAFWWPLAQVGYDYKQVGENLAANIFVANDIVSDWMNSPEHRANILDTQVKDIGVAVVAGNFQGEPSDYIVEYTGLLKPPATFAISQKPSSTQGVVLGTKITAQATGVSSSESSQIATLIQQIISLLRQIIILKQAQAQI